MNIAQSNALLTGFLEDRGWMRFSINDTKMWRHQRFPEYVPLGLYDAAEVQRLREMCEVCNGTGYVVSLTGREYSEVPCDNCRRER